MKLTFAGSNAIVTGAGGGIGTSTVTALLSCGINVAALDNDSTLLARLESRYANPGEDTSGVMNNKESLERAKLITLQVDIRDIEQVSQTVATVEKTLGPVDFCASVAGSLTTGLVTNTDPKNWDSVFDINARGVFNICKAVSVGMLERRRGSIVVVSSNAAGIPRHGMAAYAASKAAATMFVRSLGLELGPYGIRCNIVAPGSTRTAMQEGMWNETTNEKSVITGTLETFKAGIPLGKIAEPSDISNAIMFLLSEQAGHITMADLYVDGGATQRA